MKEIQVMVSKERLLGLLGLLTMQIQDRDINVVQ